MKTPDNGDHGREDETKPLLWDLDLAVLSVSMCICAFTKEDLSTDHYPDGETHVDESCKCHNTQMLSCVLVASVTTARDSNYWSVHGVTALSKPTGLHCCPKVTSLSGDLHPAFFIHGSRTPTKEQTWNFIPYLRDIIGVPVCSFLDDPQIHVTSWSSALSLAPLPSVAGWSPWMDPWPDLSPCHAWGCQWTLLPAPGSVYHD